MKRTKRKDWKYLLLITGILCFSIASSGYSQDMPFREYTNPAEVVSFDRTTSYSRALDVINSFARKYAGKMIIDRTSYKGNIGITLPPMHWRDALELILRKHYMRLIERRDYFEIVALSKTQVATGMAGRSAPDSMLTPQTKEIRIHAIFFEGNRRALQEIGVDWSTLTNNVPSNVGSFFGQRQGGGGGGGAGGGGAGGGRGGNLPVTDDSFDGPFVSINAKGAQSVSQNVFNAIINFGEVFGSGIRVQALFSAFEADNLGTILASPSIRVIEGQKGHIQVGQDFSIKQRDFAGNVIEQFFSVGTILNVIPQVIEYRDTTFIHLNIEAERSTVNPDPVSTIINKQNATTEVLMLDGETTVIAGLYQTQKTTVRKGVPILKDLPAWFFGLRYIFGYTSHSYQTRELVILITAEVVPSIEQRMDKKLIGKFDVLQKKRLEMRKDVIKYRRSLEYPDVLPTSDPQNIFEKDHELDSSKDKPIGEEIHRDNSRVEADIQEDSGETERKVSHREKQHKTEMEKVQITLNYPEDEKKQQSDVSNTISPSTKTHEFYVIGGSFKNKQNAQDFLKRLAAKGYNAEILVSVTDGFYMVSYKGFNKRSKALIFWKDIRSKNGGAWIYDNY